VPVAALLTALVLAGPVLGQQSAAPPVQQGAGDQATATGVSRAFNPAISVNGLFLGALFSGESPLHEDPPPQPGEHAHGEIGEGLRFQEAEIQLTSFVDPYFKGDLIIGIHGGEVEIEEGYLTSQALPAGWEARIGRTFTPFGKHNRLHPHQYPFVEAPLIHSMLVGDEGLSEFGAELSYLFPTPFFLQATGAVYNGDNPYFNGESPRELMGLGRISALWDLSESTTLELGTSYAAGKSGISDLIEDLSGVDATVKWRPLRRSIYTQAEWQVEYLRGSRLPEPLADDALGGLVSHLRYRFRRTWWVGARFDRTGLPGDDADSFDRYALNLAWVPGEFEMWRLQYSLTDPVVAGEPTFGAIYLQMTFTIGSHPAHAY
jgi:hypothetical protein